jgi:ATP-binding cassette subfamily B multidrug efflux pump
VLIRLIRTNLAPHKKLLAAMLVFQVGQSLLTLYLPDLAARVIDQGVLEGDTAFIWRTGAIMLVVAAVQVCFLLAAMWAASRVSTSFGRDTRDQLFHRVTSFSRREVNQLGAPSLINRITNDVQQTQMLVLMVCTVAVVAPITAVGGVVMAMREDVVVTVLLLVTMPILGFVMYLLIRQMIPQFRRMQFRIDRVNDVLRDQIVGMRVVRAFVREPEETARFDEVNADLTSTSLVAGRLMAAIFPAMLVIANLTSVGVVWISGYRIDSGEMSVGSLIALLSYVSLIVMSVMMTAFVASQAPRASVSAERILEVLDTEPSVVTAESPVVEVHESGSLELRDVSFAYPGAEAAVLHGISFRSGPGETTAIIGSTGAGKSTLMNLVPRLFDVTSGSLLIDGVDARELDPDTLRDRIGLVPQRPYLFTGSVASNLRYGAPDASDEEMWAALEVAQATDFVTAMGGLEAHIAQGGSNVSGGQRQRLSIARALVRKPEVYLFDDSFSALDLATDARLRAALRPWTVGATVVLVAQRVSSVIGADRIIVLEGGQMVGMGTHDQLMASCPTYQEIVDSQIRLSDVA